MNTNEVHIEDKLLFFLAYPAIGICFVHIGNDNSLKELIQIPSYYSDLLVAIGVTYMVGFYLRWVFQKIERRFDWETQLKSRIKYQLFWCLLIPSIFAVLVELGYLTLLNIPIADSSIFYLELPVAIVFLMLINLTYFILYSQFHTAKLKSAFEQREIETKLPQEKFLVVKQGNQIIQIPRSSVVYFILKNKLTFLVTEENRQFLLDKTMSEVMETLPKSQFYRLNRQVIAKHSSIVKCIPTETRRLKIELKPPLGEEVYLPKAKVSLFMNWLNQD